MIWKNAETDPPPDNVKILVKVSPHVGNDDYGPDPGKAVLAGKFVTHHTADFKKLENGLYERVMKQKRYFDDVEPSLYCLEDRIFEWTEFPE